MEPRLLLEAGVHYHLDAPDVQWKEFEYRWLHVPTGKKGTKRVCCANRADLLKLLAHWSRSNDWRYAPS